MQVIAVLFAVFAATQAGLIAPAVVPGTTLVRTPSLDSAVIKSDRLGGNFAYSTVEGHSYAAVSPVVQNVVSPVAVSYSANPVATPVNLVHQQVVAGYSAPIHTAYAAPIHAAYAQSYAAPLWR